MDVTIAEFFAIRETTEIISPIKPVRPEIRQAEIREKLVPTTGVEHPMKVRLSIRSLELL
jgi:hypothetical protein